MNIEITDRELWKQKCEKAIRDVLSYRAQLDDNYVNEWRNSKFKIFSREGKFPSTDRHGIRFVYPSISAWGNLQAAKDLLQLITSQGTGTIHISVYELQKIDEWSN